MRLVATLLAVSLVPLVGAIPVVDDDAGSGQDAPNSPSAGAVPVTPGVAYSGAFGPTDPADVYSFNATSGSAIQVAMWPVSTCIAIYDPSGAVRKNVCTAGNLYWVESMTADATGTWRVALSQPFRSATPYRFSVGVGAPAPNPTPGGLDVGSPLRFIQPGEQLSTPGGQCTLNFAYNGTGSKAGKVYIGTSAHCFTALGQWASVQGVPNFGTVVYMGDYDGINTITFENGIPGEQVDFALIEVNPAHHAKVKGEVKGHPGLPTALKARSTVRVGDLFYFSGYGLGFEATQPTREERFGVYRTGDSQNWLGVGPIISGDSGGPVLHADGKAVGVAAFIGAAGVGGPWLDTALAQAGAAGHTVSLRPAY